MKKDSLILISYCYQEFDNTTGFGDIYKSGCNITIEDISELKEELKNKYNFKDVIILNVVNLSEI